MFNLHTLLDAARSLLSITLSTRCLLCGGHCNHSRPLCGGCQRELPWLDRYCQHCALPMPSGARLCGECLHQPPPWRRCVAAFEYHSPVKQLIGRYKNHSDLACGRVLGELLGGYLEASKPELPDLLIAVPLHWRRQLMRGFNQSYDLARMLSARLGIPCSHRHLRKRRHTTAQHNLPRDQRSRNLRGVFEVRRPVAGLRIALIDDVVTTGSTAKAITQTLLQAGAKEVEIWCVARTPK